MRFDVAVNMLVMQAVTRGEVTVFGGDQIRPNIHIDDICDLYLYMLNNPRLVGVFNAGFENLSILEIAEMVRAHVDCKIKILDSVDPHLSTRLIKVNQDRFCTPQVGFRCDSGDNQCLEFRYFA